jgi:hypothetical protein
MAPLRRGPRGGQFGGDPINPIDRIFGDMPARDRHA